MQFVETYLRSIQPDSIGWKNDLSDIVHWIDMFGKDNIIYEANVLIDIDFDTCSRIDYKWKNDYYCDHTDGFCTHKMDFNNKLLFITSYFLRRSSSGWCVLDIDLNANGRTLLQKKCESVLHARYAYQIVRKIASLGNLRFEFVRLDNAIRTLREEKIATISFSTQDLSKYRELGLLD